MTEPCCASWARLSYLQQDRQKEPCTTRHSGADRLAGESPAVRASVHAAWGWLCVRAARWATLPTTPGLVGPAVFGRPRLFYLWRPPKLCQLGGDALRWPGSAAARARDMGPRLPARAARLSARNPWVASERVGKPRNSRVFFSFILRRLHMLRVASVALAVLLLRCRVDSSRQSHLGVRLPVQRHVMLRGHDGLGCENLVAFRHSGSIAVERLSLVTRPARHHPMGCEKRKRKWEAHVRASGCEYWREKKQCHA